MRGEATFFEYSIFCIVSLMHVIKYLYVFHAVNIFSFAFGTDFCLLPSVVLYFLQGLAQCWYDAKSSKAHLTIRWIPYTHTNS